MPESRYLRWPVFKCSWLAAFGCSLTIGNLALTAMFTAASQSKDLVELDDVVAAAREVA